MMASPLNNQIQRPSSLSTESTVKTTNNATFPSRGYAMSPTSQTVPNDQVGEDDRQERASSDGTWLTAYDNPVASAHTLTTCITLADLHNDGDYKLVMADLGTDDKDMKLKIYKGTSLLLESSLVNTPTALATFFMDSNPPQTPAIGIASGHFLFVYKNLRPYFKFTLPPLDMLEEEQQLWMLASEEAITALELRSKLERLMHEFGAPKLSARSLRLISLPISEFTDPNDEEQVFAMQELEKFVYTMKGTMLRRQTVMTCMCTVKKSAVDNNAVSCIVLGTESASIYILDPEAFTILQSMSLPATPVCLHASGLYEVDFRLCAICRDSVVYTLKRGSRTAKRTIVLPAPGVGLVRLNKTLICACADNILRAYSSHGKYQWQAIMPAAITTIESMVYREKDVSGILVGLDNGTVRMYIDRHLVSIIKLDSAPTSLCFGRFGREDTTLIITTRRGGLHVRMLKRDARLQPLKDAAEGVLAMGGARLVLPKKGKQFVKQALREREEAAAIYAKQQNDLLRLRLSVLRSYASLLRSGLVAVTSGDSEESLRLRGDVHGFGPQFRLSLELVNVSEKRSCVNLLIGFHYNDRLYAVSPAHLPVPFLVPGIEYKYRVTVECASDAGQTDIIEVFVFKHGSPRPLVSLDVKMPVSESIIMA